MTPVVPEMRTLHPRPLAPAQNARASFPPPGPAAPGRCRRPRPKPAVRKGQRSAPRSARPELVICRSRVVHVRAFSPAAGPRKGVSRGPRTGCAHFQVVRGGHARPEPGIRWLLSRASACPHRAPPSVWGRRSGAGPRASSLDAPSALRPSRSTRPLLASSFFPQELGTAGPPRTREEPLRWSWVQNSQRDPKNGKGRCP